ncbi:MAG: undecaprenyldiphospho-muramoylpentapeptide beta-N-acetylglucosaminyltransferase, partial [Alphaproteobacteria bacterium]
LFPALALAQELGRRGWEVDLITDMRGDRFGTDFPARAIYRVPAATLRSRRLGDVLRFGFTLMRGLWGSFRVMWKARPRAIAGFGGYPTFAPLMVAAFLRDPILIHEQNAVMGRANRALMRLASVIAVSFATTKHVPAAYHARVRFTGNPVRDAVIRAARPAYEAPRPDGEIHIVIFGGSQGARIFSQLVPAALIRLPEEFRSRLRIVQQCREEDLDSVRTAYRDAGLSAILATFFNDLPKRMANAHLVIARAGASTVAELAVLGVPSILVPFAHALDNDQLANATRLAEEGGAWCMLEKELSVEKLSVHIEQLLAAPVRLEQAARAARAAGKPNAVSLLADELEVLAGREW